MGNAKLDPFHPYNSLHKNNSLCIRVQNTCIIIPFVGILYLNRKGQYLHLVHIWAGIFDVALCPLSLCCRKKIHQELY